MAVYTYVDGYRHLRLMSRKTQLTLTDRQHAYLIGESIRTGLSMAELVRRAIDKVYRPELRPKIPGYELSLGLWKRPDAAIVGRRKERRLTEP
jgi:hypothetical protein